MNPTLLVELLTEELPPKALAKLGAAFANGIATGLKSRDFLDADSSVTAFASPRRLAVERRADEGVGFAPLAAIAGPAAVQELPLIADGP